jgi:uncharacterized protein YjbI with pentapeptide repeats
MQKDNLIAMLRRSVQEFNSWREENRGERIDLKKADLFGANLKGADLSWASLVGANLCEVNLHLADLRGVDFHGAMMDPGTWDEVVKSLQSAVKIVAK